MEVNLWLLWELLQDVQRFQLGFKLAQDSGHEISEDYVGVRVAGARTMKSANTIMLTRQSEEGVRVQRLDGPLCSRAHLGLFDCTWISQMSVEIL